VVVLPDAAAVEDDDEVLPVAPQAARPAVAAPIPRNRSTVRPVAGAGLCQGWTSPVGAAQPWKGVRPHQSAASRTPGGQAKTADEVCRMYSFMASRRSLRWTWTKPVSGSRWKAMKNSPASRRPRPSEPSTKL
jgi:hypothetical protein